MERIITSMDTHGRMLIPSSIRERFNIQPGEKITIEINENEIKIINADDVIDEMHKIFMKNQTNKKKSVVDDFIAKKHQEYLIEEARSKKMSKIVLDASALIALFAKEAGYQLVKKHMRDGVISSVNIAEVYKYCIETQGLTEDDAKTLIKLSDIKIIDFCAEQALINAKIIHKTKIYGLSLGDRACIALAMFKNYPILTCDKIW